VDNKELGAVAKNRERVEAMVKVQEQEALAMYKERASLTMKLVPVSGLVVEARFSYSLLLAS
jgi:hypothetical protein